MDDATLQGTLDAFAKALNTLYDQQQKVLDVVLHLTPGISSGTDLGGLFSGTTSPIPVPAAKPRWVPTFETDHFRSLVGGSVLYPVNRAYCATQATADALVVLLSSVGAKGVHDQTETGDVDAAGNPKARKLIQFHEDGDKPLTWYVNAGLLADEWVRNPDDLFPNVAQKHAEAAVATAKADPAAQNPAL